ncbi:glycosyltransferase family 4 protein [Rhodococcus pyridinivorans]|uniref:glycosyltransferase family 4 protein n=1 Tax=Rhodococcus pyridinivorans TaxID=103816 RepID=UPI0020791242|nr:glycosyltransferase family 4 protein [Rhodococcus pyridinivorans]USI91354.1 glycosyltransferase family 4 protein [Rhodococcus pyridinivorans]
MTGSEWFATVPGGLNRYFTDLYRALHRWPDVEVSAAAFGNPELDGQSWGPVGGSTLRRAWIAFQDCPVLPRDAIIDRHFGLYGRPARGRQGRHPLVVHFHGPWAAESLMAGSGKVAARTKYLIERIRYAGADRYVVLSSHFRDVLTHSYRVPEKCIRVVPPGVDLDRFRTSVVPGSSGTVLCVRRLERRMGVHILLRAWPDVLAAHPDARLVIVGTGSEEAALRAQAARSGAGSSITFEGHVDDARLSRLYEEAALTVVPSVALEGFGLIALESLAAGRAPVVTDCGGLPDAVRGLDASLIVPAGDCEALADRVAAALSGRAPGLLQCRAHAETFSWLAAAQRHIALYEELAS